MYEIRTRVQFKLPSCLKMKTFIKSIARKIARIPFVGKLVHILVAVYRLPNLQHQYYELQSLLLEINHLVKVVLPERIEGQSLTLGQLSSLLEAIGDINSRFSNIERSVPVALRNITRDTSAIHGSVDYLLRRVEFIRKELMFEMRYGASSANDVEDIIQVEILAREKLDAMRAAGDIRINIGCGHVPINGYLNVDRRKLPSVDIVAAADVLPFEAGELSEIFSAHFLEHFPKEQLVRSILPYYFGLLKSGGIFKAIVPDADGMIDAYKRGEYSFDRLREVTFGAQDYDGDFHYTMMSPESFSELLSATGFREIVIVARNRENGGCKEFEIIAKRA